MQFVELVVEIAITYHFSYLQLSKKTKIEMKNRVFIIQG